MARPLRIEFPGACYHLMCRGNFRFPVFQDPADKALILERLVHFAEIFHVRIRAYCANVSRYIHLNPACTREMKDADFEIRRENIQHRALHGSHSLDEVIAIVASHFHCAREYLLRPNSQNNHPRQVLLYLAAVYCRSQHTLCELAHSLGPISLSGLDSARQRLKRNSANRPNFARKSPNSRPSSPAKPTITRHDL
jgi:hypothetical protein